MVRYRRIEPKLVDLYFGEQLYDKLNKEYKNQKKWLKALTKAVKQTITALDAEMKKPSSELRGKHVAKICNNLEIQNDQARHFGLGEKI